MSDAHGHDAWHQHTAAEGMPQHEHASHTSTKALGLTFIIMVVGVIATILVLIAYFNSYVSTFKAERQEGTAAMKPAFEAKVAARQRLEEFGWVDREAGTVHIPLNNAIDKVVNEYGQRRSQATEQTESDVQG
jgi:Tfp pilus assembly protein PilE